jgi:hypothetical protein
MFATSAACDDWFFDAKDYAGEARQVTALIRQHQPGAGTLLDVARGTGRHLEQLRGHFACEGLHLDAGLLAAARRAAGLPPVSSTCQCCTGLEPTNEQVHRRKHSQLIRTARGLGGSQRLRR